MQCTFKNNFMENQHEIFVNNLKTGKNDDFLVECKLPDIPHVFLLLLLLLSYCKLYSTFYTYHLTFFYSIVLQFLLKVIIYVIIVKCEKKRNNVWSICSLVLK